MKKIILSAVACIAIVSLSSCAKNWTCTCTDTNSSGATTSTIVVTKATKSSVESGVCASGTSSVGSSTDTRSCTIN